MTAAGLYPPLPPSPSLGMYSQSMQAQNTFISFLVYSFINIQQEFAELQRNPELAGIENFLQQFFIVYGERPIELCTAVFVRETELRGVRATFQMTLKVESAFTIMALEFQIWQLKQIPRAGGPSSSLYHTKKEV